MSKNLSKINISEIPGKLLEIYNFFLSVIFPSRCIICNKYGEICCQDCIKSIERVKTDTCPECGRISKNSRYCPNCKARVKPSLNAIFISTSYHSQITKSIIHTLKYLGLTDLAAVCGNIMFDRIVLTLSTQNLIVVPVPLHWVRQNIRGFNQSELIGKYLAKRLNIPGGNVLTRTRNTKNQVGLQRKQRLINLEEAFDCQDADFVKNMNVLLVDDVVTTGATLNECAKALKKAGAKKVFGLVLARNV